MARRIWIPLALVACVLTVGAVGAWSLWRMKEPLLRERLLTEAQARGFDLELDEFSVSTDRVVLRGATLRPVGVRGLAARLETVTLELLGLDWQILWKGTDGVTLRSIDVKGAEVHVLGSAPALALELTRWSEQFPAAYDLEARATGVALGWRAAPDATPWLLVTNGEVAREEGEARFRAAEAVLLGKRLGSVGSSWSKKDGRIVMGLGRVRPEEAPVYVEIQLDVPEPVARLELRRTALADLTGALDLPLPTLASTGDTLDVEAKAELRLPPSLAPAAVPGQLEVVLYGFVPPHPPELQGIVTGDRTEFRTKFQVSEDQMQIALTESKVTAGRFVLEGDGLVLRKAEHAEVTLRLSEFLPCTTLASAAADTRLGKHWASLTKQLVQKYMQGSVQVLVRIEADTRDLANARVLRTIGVGCGLKPLTPPTPEDLAAFAAQLPGLLQNLPNLPAGSLPSTPNAPGQLPLPSLPKLPSSLPPLPTALPTLPKFPAPPSPDRGGTERGITERDEAGSAAPSEQRSNGPTEAPDAP